MKKLLLSFLLLGSFNAFSQLTCATATVLTPSATAVNYGILNGTYIGGCFTGTTPTGAKWYSYTPTANVTARINTNIAVNPVGGDSRVNVFTGTCAALACYAGSDDVSATNFLTDFTFVAFAGVTYYIEFDNRWAPDADNLSFEFTVTAPTCPDIVLPFVENWNTPEKILCWNIESTDGLRWAYNNGNDFDGDLTNDPVALIFPNVTNNAPKNDWLISKALTMTAGTSYTVSVKYNAFNAPVNANESFRVVMLDTPTSTATFNQQIGSATGILQSGIGIADLLPDAVTGVYTFTPATTGAYHLGLHANTATAAGIFMVFEVKVEAPLSVDDFQANNFSLYPNPAKDNFILETNAALMSAIQITDINGRIVKSMNLSGVSNTSVDVSDLKSGMYFVSVQTDNGSGTTKFIKN